MNIMSIADAIANAQVVIMDITQMDTNTNIITILDPGTSMDTQTMNPSPSEASNQDGMDKNTLENTPPRLAKKIHVPPFFRRMLLNMFVGANTSQLDRNPAENLKLKSSVEKKHAVQKIVTLLKDYERKAKDMKEVDASGGRASYSTSTGVTTSPPLLVQTDQHIALTEENVDARTPPPETSALDPKQAWIGPDFGGIAASNDDQMAVMDDLVSDHAQASDDVLSQHPTSTTSMLDGGGDTTSTAGKLVHNLVLKSLLQDDLPPAHTGDMDLIDILWRQDMDLGVGREMFDTNLRRELEKEREQELHKQRQQDLTKQQQQQQQQQPLQPEQSNVTFVMDSETGELIPVPVEQNATAAAVMTPVPTAPQPQESEEATLGEDMDDMEVAMQFLKEQVISNNDTHPHQQQQQQQQQQPLHMAPVARLNSFEQRWEDVAKLLDIPTPAAAAAAGHAGLTTADHLDVELPLVSPHHHDALLHNATLPAPQPNATDFHMQALPQPITITPNDTSFNSFNATLPVGEYPEVGNNSLLDLHDMFSQAGDVNSTHNTSSSSSNISSSSSHMPGGTMAFSFNVSADSFLQDLLDDDNLNAALDFGAMDLNNTDVVESEQPREEKMDDASSDSAVGSMAGSHSPNDLSDSMSNVSSSHYHGIEGATGGRDIDDISRIIAPKKEVLDPSFTYPDFGFSESFGAAAETNSSLNDTMEEMEEEEEEEEEEEYGEYGKFEANPRHVAHNHSYPLAPGQQPRERKLTLEEKRASAQMSRDEKKAKAMKIPFSIDDIIHSPVDEFNDMLTKYKLSESQLQLIRDIRRRGKNKVAAQNCRKRKMDVIQGLEDEVNGIRAERDRLMRERARLNKGQGDMKERYKQMYQEVFRSLRDDNGHPYDPTQFTLQQTADGNVFLVPVNTTAAPPPPQREHDDKPLHKRKGKKSNR